MRPVAAGVVAAVVVAAGAVAAAGGSGLTAAHGRPAGPASAARPPLFRRLDTERYLHCLGDYNSMKNNC